MRLSLSSYRRVYGLHALATLLAGPSPSAPPATSPVFAAGLLGVVCGTTIALGGPSGLILCLSLIGAGIILYDFRIGVIALILLMPVSSSQVFPHEMLGITGLNPVNLLLVATLGSYVLQALVDGSIRQFVPRPLLWLYVVPFLVAGAIGARQADQIVSLFYSFELIDFNDAPRYLLVMVAKPMLWIVFALLVGAAVARSEHPVRFLIPAVISMWIMGLLTLVYVGAAGVSMSHLAQSTARDFLTPLGMHANDLGRIYTFAYALLLFTWGETRSPGGRFALLVSIVMVLAATVLTFSRAAYAGVIAVSGLYLLWRRNFRALSYLGLLAALGLMALPDAVYERATTGFGEGLDAILAGRLEGLWLPLFPEVLRNPLFGGGIASILWSDTMRSGIGATVIGTTHPHNAYLQTLLDMGIVGLVLISAYFAHVWKRLLQLHRDFELPPPLRGFFLGAAAGLVSYLLAALAGGSLTPSPEQGFLWLAIGLMYGVATRRPSVA